MSFRTVVLWLFLLFPAFAAEAAEAPDWLKSALTEKFDSVKNRASAVRLLGEADITFLPGERVRKTYREVVRVLGENGFSETATALSYNADTDVIVRVQAWIISSDGKTISAFGKREFDDTVARFNAYFWDAYRVLTFRRSQQVPVGGMIAWEYVVESAQGLWHPDWSFRTSLPTVRSVFEVTPVPGGSLVTHLSSPLIPAGVVGSVPGSLRWEMRSIPAYPTEFPRGIKLNPLRVSVRGCAPNTVAARLKTWADFAQVASEIVEPRIQVNTAVANQAAALVKGKTGRWDRIQAVAEFAQKQIAYFALTLDKDAAAGYRPHLPSEILQSRFGDCKDKATLVVALLRSLGENGYVMIVNSSDPQAVVPDWPGSYFNHAIVAIPADQDTPDFWSQIEGGPLGKLVVFDPTDPASPFGILPQQDQGGFGLVLSAKTSELSVLPAETPSQNRVVRKTSAQVSATGAVSADVTETLHGARGARGHYLKFYLGSEKFTQRLESQLHDSMPMIRNLTWKEGWDPVKSEQALRYHFESEGVARLSGPDILIVTPKLIGEPVQFASWGRDVDGLAWIPARGLMEELTVTLPDAFQSTEVPRDWAQTLPSASCSISYRLEGQTLTIVYELRQNAGFFSRTDFQNLRNFYQKLSEAERRPVVLHRKKQLSG
jgi:hypothetical protein